SGKDKEIAQLLKTNANIVCIFKHTIELHNWLDHLQVYKYRTRKKLAVTTKQEEVTKEVLIKQEYGYQNYSIQELTNKIPNLEAEEQNNSEGSEMKAEEVINEIQQHQSSEDNNLEYGLLKKQIRAQSTSLQNKQHKIVEKDKEYSADDISINMHKRTVTTKQEEKLKEYKQECSESRDQDLETTKNISYKKKGKAKQDSASIIQEKENCEILAIISQILTRLNKLKE
ncbi:19620_t:CDS:2, partial [Gigaspora margarita]